MSLVSAPSNRRLPWAFRAIAAATCAIALAGCIYVPRTTVVYDHDCQIQAKHMTLELAQIGEAQLADARVDFALGIGVVDIKDNEVEAPGEIARRIEQAVKVLGAERVRWVHPDCGFWMLSRSVADRKMRALVEGRDLFCGHVRSHDR